jgi:hypothetical protein
MKVVIQKEDTTVLDSAGRRGEINALIAQTKASFRKPPPETIVAEKPEKGPSASAPPRRHGLLVTYSREHARSADAPSTCFRRTFRVSYH